MLSTRTGRVLRTIRLGTAPRAVAVDERTGRAFVAHASFVSVFDTGRAHVLGTTTVGSWGGLTAVAVDERRDRVFTDVDRAPNVSALAVLHADNGRLIGLRPNGARLPPLRAYARASAGGYPGTLAVDAGTGRVFVVDTDQNMLRIVDEQTGAILHTVPVGRSPVAVGADQQTGTVFVANRGSDTVAMIDGRTGRFLHIIAVPVGPTALAVDEQAQRVLVTSDGVVTPAQTVTRTRTGWTAVSPLVPGTGQGKLTILDARSGKIVGSIPLAGLPDAIAVDGLAKQAFIVMRGDASHPRSVHTLSLSDGRVVRATLFGPSP